MHITNSSRRIRLITIRKRGRMAEQVVMDLKEEVEKVARENDQRRFRLLCRKLDDIRDILAINNLQNTMLLRGMDKLIVQKLGVAFLNEYENKQLLKQIDDILVGMNKRNGVTQQELQEKIAEFQRIAQRGREKKSND